MGDDSRASEGDARRAAMPNSDGDVCRAATPNANANGINADGDVPSIMSADTVSQQWMG